MATVLFPSVKPSGRSFDPGRFPETVFEAQNGAKSFIRYGNKRVNANLNLEFTNITESEASTIVDNYILAAGDPSNWLYFSSANGTAGLGITSGGTTGWFDEFISGWGGRTGGLKWRYSGPPQVSSVFPGRMNVSCSFVGCFDGD